MYCAGGIIRNVYRARPWSSPFSRPFQTVTSIVSGSTFSRSPVLTIGKSSPLTTPIQRPMCRVGTPDPAAIPAALLLELVT